MVEITGKKPPLRKPCDLKKYHKLFQTANMWMIPRKMMIFNYVENRFEFYAMSDLIVNSKLILLD